MRLVVLLLVLATACVDDEFGVGDDPDAGADASTDVMLDALVEDAGPQDAADPMDAPPDAPLPACAPIGSDCDDGNACTVGETCLATGCGGGDVRDCSGPGTSMCAGSMLVQTLRPDRCEPSTGCVSERVELPCPFGCSGGDECDACVESSWSFSRIDARMDGGLATADLVVDESGGQHVAWIADRPGSKFLEPAVLYAYRSGDDATWATEQITPAMVGISRAILAVSSKPHLLYWDGTAWHYSEPDDAGTWSDEVLLGSSGRVNTSMAVSTDGVVHVVRGQFSMVHSQRVAGEWTDTTVSSIRRMGFPDLIAGPDGDLHLAYQGADYDLGYAYFDGDTWAPVDIATPQRAADPSIGITRSGEAAYILFRYDEDDHLYLAQRPGAAAGWSTIPLVRGVERVGDENAIAVDARGGVHIAFRNMTRREVEYGYAAAGGSFSFSQLDVSNGFSLNLHADSFGTIRFLDEAILEFAGSEIRFGRRQICH